MKVKQRILQTRLYNYITSTVIFHGRTTATSQGNYVLGREKYPDPNFWYNKNLTLKLIPEDLLDSTTMMYVSGKRIIVIK